MNLTTGHRVCFPRQCCQQDTLVKHAAVNALVYDMPAEEASALYSLFAGMQQRAALCVDVLTTTRCTADVHCTALLVYEALEAPLVALQPTRNDRSI